MEKKKKSEQCSWDLGFLNIEIFPKYRSGTTSKCHETLKNSEAHSITQIMFSDPVSLVQRARTNGQADRARV